MLGTPKKGRRFGGASSHQKAMMGNLVASLVAAEYLVTTEAKAKALRPVAEKVITAAAKGGVARRRQRLPRRDGAVGGDVKNETVEVGGLLDPGRLHDESSPPDR